MGSTNGFFKWIREMGVIKGFGMWVHLMGLSYGFVRHLGHHIASIDGFFRCIHEMFFLKGFIIWIHLMGSSNGFVRWVRKMGKEVRQVIRVRRKGSKDVLRWYCFDWFVRLFR